MIMIIMIIIIVVNNTHHTDIDNDANHSIIFILIMIAPGLPGHHHPGPRSAEERGCGMSTTYVSEIHKSIIDTCSY